jgi:hypothetical protein
MSLWLINLNLSSPRIIKVVVEQERWWILHRTVIGLITRFLTHHIGFIVFDWDWRTGHWG